MIYTLPDYYSKFSCLASACPASCCEGGWKIVIDDNTLNKYKEYKGEFAERFENSIDWEDKTFKYDNNGKCAFLNDKKLCDIHSNIGLNDVCNTCRTYPKHIEEYENERDISLSMSCPAAAELILGQKEKAVFNTIEKGEDESDFDFDNILYSFLLDTREVMFQIAQNRSESLNVRMAKILSLAADVQSCIDESRIFDIQNVLEEYQHEDFELIAENDSESDKFELKQKIFDYISRFEILSPLWNEDLQTWRNALYGNGYEYYLERVRNWDGVSAEWETEYEQILVYFLFTYFCGAAYDGEALKKVQMAVVSVIMLEEIGMVEWLKNNKLTFEDRVKLAWRYSRELEHSDLNREAVQQMFSEWEETDFDLLIDSLSV